MTADDAGGGGKVATRTPPVLDMAERLDMDHPPMPIPSPHAVSDPTSDAFWLNCGAHSKHAADAQCLVVMYHYIRPPDPQLAGGVKGLSPEDFEAQLKLLTSDLEPINWPALCAGMEKRQPLPPRSFLLTFDDGLSDHGARLLPILDTWGLRGTFFIPGVVMTSRKLLAAHAMHILLGALGDAELFLSMEEEAKRLGIGPFVLSDENVSNATRVYHYEPESRARIKYMLNFVMPRARRDQLVESIFDRVVGSSCEWADRWYLRWDDLIHMQGSGHTIGGHGFAHEPYARMSSEEALRDARKVANVLSEGLGPDRRPFSFPFGSFCDSSVAAVFDAGFVQAFTTRKAWACPSVDSLRLPRIDATDVAQFVQGVGTC